MPASTPRPGLRALVGPLLGLGLAIAGLATAQAGEPFAWSGEANGPLEALPYAEGFWGRENVSYHPDPATGTTVTRVFVPRGAYDPASMLAMKKRPGGTGCKLRLLPEGSQRALLSYRVRFPADFDFVLGGKLPGLFGGAGNSGGHIPNGSDGFSFRLMWGSQGKGSIYAYLPTSVGHGTPLLHRQIQFQRGQWHSVAQEVVLNTPGATDGLARIWLDGQLIGEAGGLNIRTTSALKINGVFFEVFFGGGDPNWAATSDTHIDFADLLFRGFPE